MNQLKEVAVNNFLRKNAPEYFGMPANVALDMCLLHQSFLASLIKYQLLVARQYRYAIRLSADYAREVIVEKYLTSMVKSN